MQLANCFIADLDEKDALKQQSVRSRLSGRNLPKAHHATSVFRVRSFLRSWKTVFF